MNTEIERGAASFKMELSEGAIRIYHGTDKVMLAELIDAPEGTWDAIWKCFDSLGIKRLYG